MKHLYLVVILFIFVNNLFSQKGVRTEIQLNDHWKTTVNDSDQNAFRGFEAEFYNDNLWKTVDVPHNWDTYEGYRRLKHGNRHGYAWYRKNFQIPAKLKGKQIFLWFEGVGSYATVWVNGKKVGYHAGGRTSFTLDITNVADFANPNILAVRADHPAFIKDLPWVCGGCSDEYGFSEGSQPMGIFRPVHLIATNSIRIQPFGVHIWNDITVSEQSASLFIETELKNYSSNTRNITVVNKLLSKDGKVVGEVKVSREIKPSAIVNMVFTPISVNHPHLWSLSDPYLYSLETSILEDGKCVDQVTTPYGIRWISWPIGRKDSTGRFLLNGKPVFINGVAEYEHLMGQSHAFSDEQIHTRVMQVKAAGFNAFRDAHQPHNLRYQQYWDQLGLLWWPQMAAHIWYDTPEFRGNFKNLLTDWIKERRNSPSVILWGLENESVLPESFAKECSDLIRKLDPTASSQRKITTCNGGTGTDWNVVQNWSGTYGSNNPLTYGQELTKQLLNGEYGAWRSIDLHTEGPFVQTGPISEDRFTQLMESKVRLAEGVKDHISGQFLWLLSSHENPGRIQNGEGLRDIDRIGPVNYKGIFTPWGEPLDAFYMFRSNYVSKDKEPMVYIVSHTWPDRWKTPGVKDSIIVYSNCDSVELFNDVNASSPGFRKKDGIGTHFQWNHVPIRYNVLYAKGYVNGKPVAVDYIVLHHLPKASHATASFLKNDPVTPQKGYHYLYRVKCGGPDYLDHLGNLWSADRQKTPGNTWGSRSWTDDFAGLAAFYGSQRRTFDRITGTSEWKLFQSFRYGRDKLQYEFTVPNGDYQVELFFTEPWYGIGGGMDCTGWRLFDVAVNGRTMIQNLDIWKETGTCNALRKTIRATADQGKLVITFPRVASGEAVISAIAISSKSVMHVPEDSANPVISQFTQRSGKDSSSIQSWLDQGDNAYSNDSFTFVSIPSNLYGATWIQSPRSVPSGEKPLYSFRVTKTSDVYLALDSRIRDIPGWMNGFINVEGTLETDAPEGNLYKLYSRRFETGSLVELGDNGTISEGSVNMYIAAILPVTNMPQTGDLRPVKRYEAGFSNHMERLIVDTVYGKKGVLLRGEGKDTLEWSVSVGIADTYALKFRYVNKSKKSVTAGMRILSADGRVVCSGELNFPTSPEKWRSLNTDTGSNINAGDYTIQLWVEGEESLPIDFLEIQ